jgi:uracil-DNA glycosylase
MNSPQILSALPATEPAHDCALCPRLAAYRQTCHSEFPNFWNAPVPAFGDPDAWLAIVGLAPGKHGANRTGRPFTGDPSGEMLFAGLRDFDLITYDPPEFTRHLFGGFRDDGASLKGVMILNAVKCVPPENKPTPEEMRTCRPYLESALAALPKLTTIIALGQVAHQSVVKACGEKLPKRRFAHGAVHHLLDGRRLIDSYHTSRYNQNTGRMNAEMLHEVFTLALAR